MQIAKNFPFSRNIFLHLCFLPYQTWPCDIVAGSVHHCEPGGSMRACHAAGPGSIPGRDKFPGWGFYGDFPHLYDKCREALGPQGPGISFGHHYHHKSSFTTGANDLRCWRALKNSNIGLHIYVAGSDRHTYVKKVSIMNLEKTKYRSKLADHHLKNLLILTTSSVNPNNE